MHIDGKNNLRRLAFFGLTGADNQKLSTFNFKTIKPEETDCIM